MFKKISSLLILLTVVLNATETPKTNKTVSNDGYFQVSETKSYTRYGDVVVDNVSKLQWQDNESIKKPWIIKANYTAKKYNRTDGDTAATYCSNLRLGNFNNWRVPKVEELESIIDGGEDINKSVKSKVFKHKTSHYYWSSTTYKNLPSYALYVGFNFGYTNRNYKYYSNYVRCVREGQ